MALEDEKCMACEGGIEPLTIEEAAKLGEQVHGWTIKEKSIERTFKFINFAHAMEFANKVAVIAEEENHHPEMRISWGRVIIELHTHAIGGLSINDFIVAAKINRLL